MSLHLRALVIEEHDPAAAAAFWAGLLAREPVRDLDGILLPGTPTQVGLRFVPSTSPGRGTSWLHLHVTSDDVDHSTPSSTPPSSSAVGVAERRRCRGGTCSTSAMPEGTTSA